MFVGPTTMYALMEAIGIVDDHLAGCHRHGPRADRSLTYQPSAAVTLDECAGSTGTLCQSLWGAGQRTTDGRRLQPAAVTVSGRGGPR